MLCRHSQAIDRRPQSAGRVRIVDWEARDENVRAEPLHAAIAAGRLAGLVTWTSTLTPAVRWLLQDAGFAPVDLEETARGLPGLLLRPIGPQTSGEDWILAGRRLLDPSQWDLRLIYSMYG